jgi:hypothetical protein
MKFFGALFLLAAGLSMLCALPHWPASSQIILPTGLLYAVLRAIAAPLAIVTGWHKAMPLAAFVLGPFGFGLLGIALAFAVRSHAEDRLLWMSSAAAGLLALAAPGLINPAIWLAALLALAAGCTIKAWRGDTGYGFLAGLCAGFAVWLSPACLPLAVLTLAPLWLRWLQAPIGAAVLTAAAGCMDVIGFGYAINPPPGGYLVTAIGHISVLYAAFSFLVFLAASFLLRLQKTASRRRRNGLGLILMAGLLLIWLSGFSKFSAMPGNDLHISTLLSHPSFHLVMLPGILALLYVLWRSLKSNISWPWLYLVFCSIALLAAAAYISLFTIFPAALAAALLPVALSEAFHKFKKPPVSKADFLNARPGP